MKNENDGKEAGVTNCDSHTIKINKSEVRMSIFRLCNECAIIHGILPHYDFVPNLTGSAYTLDKFIKHTDYQALPGLLSIYDDPSYSNYENYCVSGLNSGSCTVYENAGVRNVNVEWFAGSQVGITYENGQPLCPADAIVVAWANKIDKIHPIPFNSDNWRTEPCAICRKLILAKHR